MYNFQMWLLFKGYNAENLWCFQAQRTQPPAEEEEDAEEEETEELGHVDTYAEYKPSKCRQLYQINLFYF